MTKHTSDTLTSTASSPALSRRSTDSEYPERRQSKMGHIMTSIRGALAQEQERFFPNSRASHHRESPPNITQDSGHDDRQDMTKASHQELLWKAGDDCEDNISPAIEARNPTWGWPGLGTYPETAKYSAASRRSSTVAQVRALEPRFEAATMEAIDNAAESESFGWPGIGFWPSSKK